MFKISSPLITDESIARKKKHAVHFTLPLLDFEYNNILMVSRYKTRYLVPKLYMVCLFISWFSKKGNAGTKFIDHKGRKIQR